MATREEVLDQLETEKASSWAWYMQGQPEALDDYAAYLTVYCMVKYFVPGEYFDTMLDMIGALMRQALDERSHAFYHAIDIAGQLC